jgi:hypothetical protein
MGGGGRGGGEGGQWYRLSGSSHMASYVVVQPMDIQPVALPLVPVVT